MPENPTGNEIGRLVDEALLAGREDTATGLFRQVASKAESAGVTFKNTVVLEYLWGLARVGVVALLPGHLPTFRTSELANLPEFLLTERGRKLLERGESSPHNPSKYLAMVMRRVSKPDDIALSYLSEAVEAWRCGLNRSSAVMLGCACERLILLLAEAISANPALPGAKAVRKALDGRVFISDLFDKVRSSLTCLKDGKELPREQADALDRKLSAIFDHARGLRNQAGHPTEEQVSAENAEAGLLLFPGFCELVDRIVGRISEVGASLAACGQIDRRKDQ